MKKLGRYRLIEVLGQGGMGDVYSAVSEGLGGFEKKVCVKVMREELTGNERAVELFLREARLAARLTHPNIVQIFELGREQGVYFIAMEMLEGLPWHDIAQRCWRHGKVLPLEVIVTACAQAAEALQYAHTLSDKDGKALGMVHRDVSPDNLFLTTDGTTKVLDFGIAKALSGDTTRLTEKGELRGKLPYMPPEQVKTDDISPAADTWALGITLFYLSTAQRPFDRDSPLATMNAILKEPAISATGMNPVLPKSFADVVAHCFNKEPRDRWPSAAAVRDALLGLLPAPTEPARARELLALASSLEKGDRRPLSAQPCAPTMSWEKRPPQPLWEPPSSSSSSRGRPEDRLPSRQPEKAAPRATAPTPVQKVKPTLDLAATTPQRAQPAPRVVERTTVSAPLLTADESAESSVAASPAPGDDVSSEEQENDFDEDSATLAEMPSVSDANDANDAGSDLDDEGDTDNIDVAAPGVAPGVRAEPTLAAARKDGGFTARASELASDDVNDGGSEPPRAWQRPERGPEQPDFHALVTAPNKAQQNVTTASEVDNAPLPRVDLRPDAVPTRTLPQPDPREKERALAPGSRAEPRPPRPSGQGPPQTAPLPVWMFGVGAFGVTVLVALLIVALVHFIRG